MALHRRNYIKIQNVKAAYLEYIFSSKFIQNKSKNTNAWEQRKLGEVATFLNGRAYKQDELLSKGKYPVLRVGNFNTNDRWYFSDLELPSKFYADNGDLLYTWATIFFTTYLEWKKGYLSLPYMESRSFGEIR
ncbi:restriction endonuclease subunit S [Actinobacillus seminis]|uniref:restriction endonuclease subunit S n=1 Tax=Actinobacillus seminis TaxID=722 RepID=UPI002351793F|nr:restriction endonuclease subunit S [Actinobacillus seminis]